MTTYRRAWSLVAPIALALGVLAGSRRADWGPTIAAIGIVGPMGALLRYSLVPGVRLWSRPVLRWGLNGIWATLLVCTLSAVVGPWALTIVPLWLCSSPEVVSAVLRGYRRKRPLPADLRSWDVEELGRRWRTSADDLTSPRTDVGRRLVLVQERSRLLDEIERRDPRRFEAELARAGWPINEISER